MKFLASLVLLVLAAFTGTALAASAATDPTMSDLVKQVFDAVVHGQWWIAASAGVVLAVALGRKYMPDSWKAGVKGDIIGTATAFAVAFAGAIATTFAAPGAVMSFAVALTALKVGAAAIGGFTIINNVVKWLAAWGKLPAWAMTILNVVAMVIGSSAVKKAEAAGDAAVAATPGAGMSAGGAPREVE